MINDVYCSVSRKNNEAICRSLLSIKKDEADKVIPSLQNISIFYIKIKLTATCDDIAKIYFVTSLNPFFGLHPYFPTVVSTLGFGRSCEEVRA